jgi:tryptophanyl-tRNA synthetase
VSVTASSVLRATQVPVGEDQTHNLELVQHLAKIFNNRYGHTFPIPKAVMAGNVIIFKKTYMYYSTDKISKGGFQFVASWFCVR